MVRVAWALLLVACATETDDIGDGSWVVRISTTTPRVGESVDARSLYVLGSEEYPTAVTWTLDPPGALTITSLAPQGPADQAPQVTLRADIPGTVILSAITTRRSQAFAIEVLP